MPLYGIAVARSARKELQALPPKTAKNILAKIEQLSSNPRPSGCKKLHGNSALWRIRVGDYRVVYSIDDDNRMIDVSIVRHRSEAYD